MVDSDPVPVGMHRGQGMNWRGIVILVTLLGLVFLVGILPGWLELRAERRERARVREMMRKAGMS
jgi:predicted MFS family arabinose efflux permease